MGKIEKVRHYEKLKAKMTKLKMVIIYINSCKKEDLIPTFAKKIYRLKVVVTNLREKLRN